MRKRCLFLTPSHHVISFEKTARPSNDLSGQSWKELPLEIFLSESSASPSPQALFFCIDRHFYFVIHTAIGNIHLSKSQAVEKGLLIEWPYLHMNVLPPRSQETSLPHSEAKLQAFQSLSSLLERMEQNLTIELMRHPILDKCSQLNQGEEISHREYFNRLIKFTKLCQLALDPPLSEDDRTSLVLTGHSNVSSETSKSHLTSELFVSYRSTLLSDISVRSSRESTSNELSQVYTQLNHLLDMGFSSNQPLQDGDKVMPRRHVLPSTTSRRN